MGGSTNGFARYHRTDDAATRHIVFDRERSGVTIAECISVGQGADGGVGAAQRLPIDVVDVEVEEGLHAARRQARKLDESLVENRRLARRASEDRAIGEIEAAKQFAAAERAGCSAAVGPKVRLNPDEGAQGAERRRRAGVEFDAAGAGETRVVAAARIGVIAGAGHCPKERQAGEEAGGNAQSGDAVAADEIARHTIGGAP